MANDEPVLIEAVINGAATKEWNPNVPRSVAEVRDEIHAVLDAGASMVHNHPGDGATGHNGYDFYVAAWTPVLEARPGAIVYPTLGGGTTYHDRFGHVPALAEAGLLHVGPIDAGSVNLGAIGPDGMPVPNDFVYANSFGYINYEMQICREYNLAPTFAIFDASFLRCVLAWYRAGELPQGAWLKFYFGGDRGYPGIGGPDGRGMPFGLPPTEKALDAYLEMMEGCDIPWGVSAVGGDVVECGIAELALERGGHIHVGLEMFAAERQPTNVELVEEVVNLCRKIGREPLPWEDCASYLEFPAV